MALSRKYLQGMGLTEEQVNAIIESNEETINGLKDEIDKYKSASEDSTKKLNKVQKELDSIKEEAEKNDGRSPYKVKYEALQEDMAKLKDQFDKYKADVDAKEVKSKKSDAYRKLLKEAGVSEKRLDAVIKVTDIDALEFDDDGNLKGKEDLVKGIKDEWSDFIQTESKQGVNVSNPPANNGGGKKTKEEILAIKNTAERQKAMLENKDLFI